MNNQLEISDDDIIEITELTDKFLLKYDKSQILKNFGLSPDRKTILFFGGGEFGLGKTKTFKLVKSFVQKCNDFLKPSNDLGEEF